MSPREKLGVYEAGLKGKRIIEIVYILYIFKKKKNNIEKKRKKKKENKKIKKF